MRRAISSGLLDIFQTLILTINPEKHTILPISRNDLDKSKISNSTNTSEKWIVPLNEVIVHQSYSVSNSDPKGGSLIPSSI